MPQRKTNSSAGGRMARPRTNSRTGGGGRRASSSSSKSSLSPLLILVLRVWGWFTGSMGQQFLSLVIIAFGLLTLITIYGANSGVWISAWARFLVFAFGWGAYSIAAFIIALGLLWLRHLVHQPTAWRWRPVLGFEITFIALLTLTQTLMNDPYGWHLVEAGRGGGVVGWALFIFLSDFGSPLITGVIMGLLLLLGIGLAFDLTRSDIKLYLQRLMEVGSAWKARREARRAAIVASQSAAAMLPTMPSSSPPVAAEPSINTASPRRVSIPSVGALAVTGGATRPAATQEPAATSSPATDVGSGELYPPLDLLRKSNLAASDPDEIKRKSKIIEVTLSEFGIPARVMEVRPGPTVTQFGVSPGYISRGPDGDEQRKVRVSQIASLADDLALALAARSLRMEAPVPGRAVVGIEVPNDEIDVVGLRGVLESENFRKCGKPLCFAVGLDVAGEPIVADLSAMPHLLVAGTTGSGKSVFVKSLAASLIMFNTPEDLRVIAIDPKMVELSHLNGLPHLLGRAETDIEQIIRVLRWVAQEMESRYKSFSEAVARNIDDYNRKMRRKKEPPLPRIVVLIDELADLMMSVPEETERTLTRIAQMARATGIHLVVATQRPSTDVVTGLIKANFPARLTFATTSNTDSRVIIDAPGAESLLGRGDMLFLPPDAAAPVRVQGCYITDSELEAIIRAWQKLAGATPSKAPWEEVAESTGPNALRLEGFDEDAGLLEKAIALTKKQGQISTSGLQRRLHISYNRAARLVEEMEKMGIIGPQASAGRKRKVILGNDVDDDEV